MNDMARRLSLPAGAALALAAGWALAAAPPRGQQAAGPLRVWVSILPQADMVRRIGGERVEVEVLVGQGQSPEMYEPTPRQMARLGQAEVWLRVGVPFETALLPRIAGAFPALPVVDTRAGIALLPMGEQAAPGHVHDSHRGGGHAGHVHEGDDPHLWLDPRRVRAQLDTIAAALARLRPDCAEEFERNRDLFAAELDTLDAELAALLAPHRGCAFHVYHPAFGYFAAAYGLTQIPVQVDGREPTARELAAVIERARRDGARVLFTQPQYAARGARAAAEALGARLVELDDLAPDYVPNLRRLAHEIAAACAAAAEARR